MKKITSVFFLISFIFLCGYIEGNIENSDFIDNEENMLDRNNFIDNVEGLYSSSIPTFITDVKTNTFSFSPNSSPGIKDEINFFFKPSEESRANLTITAERSLIDTEAEHITVEYYNNKIYALSKRWRSDLSYTEFQLFTSDNEGLDWEEQPECSFENIGVNDYVTKLDLKIDQNSGVFFLALRTQHQTEQFPDTFTYLYNSTDKGQNWNLVSLIGDEISDYTLSEFTSITFSSDNSKIYACKKTYKPSDYYVFFLESSDNGLTWQNTTLYIGDWLKDGEIVVDPDDNTITCFWWEQRNGDDSSIMASISTDNGASFSEPFDLNTSNGLGYSLMNEFTAEKSIQAAYSPNGILNLFFRNNSKLYQASSLDNGNNWENITLIRDYTGSEIWNSDIGELGDGNYTLCFISDHLGIIQINSAFALPLRKIYTEKNTLVDNTGYTYKWNGKDLKDNDCFNALYQAEVSIKSESSGELNPNPSIVNFKIDNSSPNIDDFSLSSLAISPNESPGINDSVSISFSTNESIDYELSINKSTGRVLSDSHKIEDSLNNEMHADFAVDSSGTIYCAYCSLETGNRDIYLIKSVDDGVSWSEPEHIVSQTRVDDFPSIDIYQDELYLVWVVTRSEGASIVDDVFFKHTIGGMSEWSSETNLTDGFRADPISIYETDYHHPNIEISEYDGYIYVAWFRFCYSSQRRYYEIISSDNLGSTWGSPVLIHEKLGVFLNEHGQTKLPIGIACSKDSSNVSVVVSDWEQDLVWGYHDFYELLYSSDDHGASWNYISKLSEGIPSRQESIGLDLIIDDNGVFTVVAYACAEWGDYLVIKVRESKNNGLNWQNKDTDASFIKTNMEDDVFTDQKYESVLDLQLLPNGNVLLGYWGIPDGRSDHDISIFLFEQTVKTYRGALTEGEVKEITWNGKNNWDQYVSSENYTIILTVSDEAGNQHSRNETIILDNEVPEFRDFTDLDLLNMDPHEDESVKVGFIDTNALNVTLYYRYSATQSWVAINCIQDNNNYTTIIPGDAGSSEMYFYANATDVCGNSYITDEYYYYHSISFEIKDLTQILDNSTYDEFTLNVTILKNELDVDTLYLEYEINEMLNRVELFNITNKIWLLDPIVLESAMDSVEYRLLANYTNGNIESLENITLNAPDFTISSSNEILDFSSGDQNRKLDDEITIGLNGLPTDYISEVFLDYKFNNATSYTSIRMDAYNSTGYLTILQGSPQMFQLDFKVRVIDTKGEIHTYMDKTGENAITQQYIPKFPEIQLNDDLMFLIALISSLVAIIFSILYFFNKKSYVKNIQERFRNVVEDIELQENNKKDKNLKKKKKNRKKGFIEELTVEYPPKNESSIRKNIMYIISTIGGMFLMLYGIVNLYIYQDGVIGLLASAGTLLLFSLALVERILINGSKSIYDETKPKNGAILIHMALILGTLVVLLYSGTLVEWFNYYIISETITLGPMEIPSLWLSLGGTFITSIVVVVVTSINELKRIIAKIEQIRKQHANWKTIWIEKESNISKTYSRVGLKTVTFLVLVGFTVISTTNLSRYSDVGFLIIGPFLLIILIALGLNRIINKKSMDIESIIDDWLVEEAYVCSQCGAQNLYSNYYCTNCGDVLKRKNIVVKDNVKCEKCGNTTPKNNKFCRYCRNELQLQRTEKY
ncbi:MAG: hypothetical protein GF364_02855 [Candidatus Lokiarchaeota archaeon]|nr:hypothetical protein [Candidatus Lokiarchaeota archaeon]